MRSSLPKKARQLIWDRPPQYCPQLPSHDPRAPESRAPAAAQLNSPTLTASLYLSLRDPIFIPIPVSPCLVQTTGISGPFFIFGFGCCNRSEQAIRHSGRVSCFYSLIAGLALLRALINSQATRSTLGTGPSRYRGNLLSGSFTTEKSRLGGRYRSRRGCGSGSYLQHIQLTDPAAQLPGAFCRLVGRRTLHHSYLSASSRSTT